MLPLDDLLYLKSLSKKERKQELKSNRYYYIWIGKKMEYEQQLVSKKGFPTGTQSLIAVRGK